MTSASNASRKVIGPMNADTGQQEDPEAGVIREDTRKTIKFFTLLVVLDLEIEDIEVDLDPIEETTPQEMRAASNAVRQDISRGTVLK